MIVLMPNCGFLSETSRLIAVAEALRARGTEVLIASHGGPYASLLGTPGTDWIRLTDLGDGLASQSRFIRGFSSWGTENLPLYDDDELRTYVAAETELLRDTRADVVHIGFTLSAYLSSRAAGVPLSTSHVGSFVDPVLRAGLAPVPLNPAREDLARLPHPVQRRAVNLVPRLLRAPASQLNALADELGLPPVAGLMGLMSGDLVCVTETAEVLGVPVAAIEEWHGDWTSRRRRNAVYRLTGPLFAQLDVPVPAEVDRFLSAHDDVVYVSPTSVSETALREMVAAVRRSGAPVLVGATLHDVADLRDERTCVAGVLPNHVVAPRVAALVGMGGQGTVQTAMASGAPMVGFPMHPEQELNIALAQRYGCALGLPLSAAGTDELTRAVRTLLEEPSFRRRAHAAAAHYAEVDGPGNVADALLAYLERRPSTVAAGRR